MEARDHSMATSLKLTFENKKGYRWITLPDSINKENFMVIRERIESDLGGGTKKKVTFDLSNMEMVNSTAIDLIMKFRNSVVHCGGEFCVVNITEKCIMQLRSVNLDKILTIYRSEKEMPSKRKRA